jgi:hypothetical protein
LKHYTPSDFWLLYQNLPFETRVLADKNYDLLKENPRHPSLQLKRIDELWSVRIGKHYRAIGIDALGGIQWIWIGSHADYDKIIAGLKAMNTAVNNEPRISAVEITDQVIAATLDDGRTISVPLI